MIDLFFMINNKFVSTKNIYTYNHNYIYRLPSVNKNCSKAFSSFLLICNLCIFIDFYYFADFYEIHIPIVTATPNSADCWKFTVCVIFFFSLSFVLFIIIVILKQSLLHFSIMTKLTNFNVIFKYFLLFSIYIFYYCF